MDGYRQSTDILVHLVPIGVSEDEGKAPEQIDHNVYTLLSST